MNTKGLNTLLILTLFLSSFNSAIYAMQPNTITNKDKTVIDMNNDKRRFIRVSTKDMTNPIKATSNGKVLNVENISRGGLLVVNSNNNVGEIIPIIITYKNYALETNAKVVRKNDKHIGLQFITNDIKTENNLMYLSIMLENDNGLLKTRFSEHGVL